jgi:kynurenine formamidase
MCNVCVMNSVKQRMLTRRDMLRVGALGAAGIAAAGSGILPIRPVLAQPAQTVADLTHELHEEFPTFFGDQQFFREQLFNWTDDNFNLLELRINEHTGTHMDAPLHFSEDGMSVAEIPVENLVVPLAVIDIRQKAADDADAQVTPDDLAAWVEANGDIPEGACVAMNSGWQQHLGSDMYRNADDEDVMHFPGFHVEAVQMLLEETTASGIAVDTLSLDHGMSPDFATHYAWLPAGRWGIECIANLDSVPASGATLVAGAPKHRGGTGGPARIFALI